MLNFTEIIARLHELNWLSLSVRSLLALVIGGALGFERGKRNQPAGFRTHMLVCFGAALVMMTSQFMQRTYSSLDPARLGAQVISGVGFLGAGTIILTRRNQVKGITTAAGLWAAACTGLAVGIGFYSGAIVAGVVIHVVMSTMQRFDSTIQENSLHIPLYLELDRKLPLSAFLTYAREHQLEVSDIQIIKNRLLEKCVALTLTAKTKCPRTRAETIQAVRAADGVQFLEEL